MAIARPGTYGGSALARGTGAGTSLVHDICPGSCSGQPGSFTVLGTKLYFQADDGVHGTELWSSDGNPGGTTLVASDP